MADQPQETAQDESTAGAVEMLTGQQICERLQISLQTFRRLRKRYDIPTHKLGPRSLRYDPVEVMRVVDKLEGIG